MKIRKKKISLSINEDQIQEMLEKNQESPDNSKY